MKQKLDEVRTLAIQLYEAGQKEKRQIRARQGKWIVEELARRDLAQSNPNAGVKQAYPRGRWT